MPRIHDAARAHLAEAVRLVAEAQAMMQLATRFGEESDVGTVLIFDKSFARARPVELDNQWLELDSCSEDAKDMSLRVTRTQGFGKSSPSRYSYAALRAPDGYWYLTGVNTSAKTWDELVEFIGDSPCRMVTATVEIPVDPPEVIEQADVSDNGHERTAADILRAQRPVVMRTVQRLQANGQRRTAKQIVDALEAALSEDADE